MLHSTVSKSFKGIICVGWSPLRVTSLAVFATGALSRGVSTVLLDFHRTIACMPTLLKGFEPTISAVEWP